jgi:hypothetical protein
MTDQEKKIEKAAKLKFPYFRTYIINSLSKVKETVQQMINT